MPKKKLTKPKQEKTKKPYSKPRVTTLQGEDVSHWITDLKLRERGYEKLLSDPPEIVRRRLALLEKRTKEYLGRNVRIFVKFVTQQELDIIAKLMAAGIPTEVPFDFKLVTANGRERGPMAFLDAGITLKKHIDDIVDRSGNKSWMFREEVMAEVLISLSDIIGKMHAQGVEHGHATLSNALIHNGKICVTDFSMAEQKHVNWNSAESIYNSFLRDYATIIFRPRRNFYLSESLFNLIISHYPTSKEIKREVLSKIMHANSNYRYYGIHPYRGPC